MVRNSCLSKCLTIQLASGSQVMMQCDFPPLAKRLESYQEAASEDEDFAGTPSGSLSHVAKPRAPSGRTLQSGPLGGKPSKHLAGSWSALGGGEGAGEGPRCRQAAFSSPMVSVCVT